MAESGAWRAVAARRLSRRRALAGSGAALLGGALLAACGGSSGGGGAASGQPATKSGLVTSPSDTTKQAKRGGVFKSSLAAEVTALDPHFQTGSALSTIVPLAVGRLTILKAGYQQEATGEFIGDLAQSWEFSPDRLQLTFKLRPDAAFAPVPPVNGRLMDAQDIIYSWNRFAKVGAARSDYANAVNPNAPIVSLTAPDSATIVMKLAAPDVTIPALLSAPQSGRFNILPRESDGGYDPRRTLIGTGPFYMSENTPSVRYVFKRNPGYWDKSFPLMDGIEYPFLPEYATASSQFRTGGLYTYALRQEDVLQIKQDTPDLLLYQTPVTSGGGVNGRFGYRVDDKNVFQDQRVRQAYSMSIDRDLFLDVVYNITKFKQQGLAPETRWNSATLADEYKGWWLDPQGKDFGPNAMYYKHDPAEAKKLLAAAGHANGIEAISNFAPAGYDSSYPTKIETLEGMAGDAGFSFKKNLVEYAADFQPHYRDSHGDFDGVAYEGGLLTLNTDAVGRLAGIFYSGSGTFIGARPDGAAASVNGDPYVDDQIKKARLEPDDEKRRQLMLDLQRYLGKTQYVLRDVGAASAFQLYWPAVKNVGVYYNEVRPLSNNWLDAAQKPLA